MKNLQCQLKDSPLAPKEKQITVAVFKVDAVKAGLAEEIIGNLHNSGLNVLHQQEQFLANEEAAEFHNQHESSDH